MNIDTLAPWKLNALAAEKIMEIKAEYFLPYHYVIDSEIKNTPDYSTNIQAAFEVVEAMIKKGYSFQLNGFPASLESGYIATLFKDSVFETAAETPALAICRCALECVMEGGE